MKRAGHLYQQITEPENLRLAFWKAQRSKQDRADVIAFRARLDEELGTLRQEVLAGTVRGGDYRRFTIRDPKERLICAASFRERVLHHALMNVCEPVFERYAIFDSYACRLGKGSHAAVRRAQVFARQYACCLKLDVAKYFDSIDHELLMTLLARRFKDPQLLALFARIVGSYERRPGRGLPIGSLTSQHLANHYLGPLDHYVKEQLCVAGYVRYMDDLVLWGGSRAELRRVLGAVRAFARDHLHLTLKVDAQLQPTRLGLSFLGFRVFPYHIGLTRRSRRRFVDCFREYEQKVVAGTWTEADLARHLEPLVGFTLLAEATGFRRSIVQRYGVLS